MGHALIVEDDADSARMMAELVASQGFSAATARSLHDARRQLALQQPDIVLLDLRLPDGNGMTLLDDTELIGNSEVVLMTGHASLETSIQALRYGAADYLVKPVSAKQLHSILSRVMKPSQLRLEVDSLQQDLRRTGRFGHLVGTSAPMVSVYEQIARVAGTSVTVFVTGESGTGKELVARALHDNSSRAKGPYLRVHCAAFPEQLLEAELFGHARGAFTGAASAREGRFEAAHGGTLLLDEIGEVPLSVQVKLLRVLQEREIERLGENQTRKVDVRILAATHRDLPAMVRNGEFRADLYYRLRVLPLHVPALRERRDDIPLLVTTLLANIRGRQPGRDVQVSADALDALCAYDWPGNVRELANALEYAQVHADGTTVLPRHLPPEVRESRHWIAGSPAEVAQVPSSSLVQNYYRTPVEHQGREKEVLLRVLQESGGNRAAAARKLGMSRTTLWKRLKQYGIDEAAG